MVAPGFREPTSERGTSEAEVTNGAREPTSERGTSEAEVTNGAPWAVHRRRAEALRERYPHAAQPLTLYLALLEAWDEGWRLAGTEGPDPARLAAWAAERIGPAVVKATEAVGPEALARAVVDSGSPEPVLAAWLAGEDQPPVERYLARACLHPALVALEVDAGLACRADPSPRDDRHCPRCGGPPQLSWRDASGEALVSARRLLLCARCGHDWAYTGSACPACGEATGSKRTVYAERRGGPVVGQPDPGPAASSEAPPPPADALLPHLRVEACDTCSTYLIDVDKGREPRAVPEVDELVGLPLDLYAGEHGLTKITRNLMGF
jgi:FdhE protein